MDLVLNTFGTALNRDNEGFVIDNRDGRHRVPIAGITSIQLTRGTQITSDAVLLAIENEIEVVFTDGSGSVAGRVWSPKYGSISTIRKGQLVFTYKKNAVGWIKSVIRKKIESQQSVLLAFSVENEKQQALVNKSVKRLEDYRKKISELDGDLMSDVASTLRGWEGMSSKIYFDTMNLFLPEHLRFEFRSQHPAMDVVNAFLNYGYGILYGKIESALIKAGIDPYIGILHRDNYNRPVLVYDVIELYRAWVDYVVYGIAAQNIINDDFYIVRDDGSCWLNPVGRRLVIQSLNDYLDEVIEINGNQRSRLTQIKLYAQDLAQKFKAFG